MNANECRLCVYLFRLQKALLKEMQHTCCEISPLFCANTFNEFPNESCSLYSLDQGQKLAILLCFWDAAWIFKDPKLSKLNEVRGPLGL